MKFAIDFHIHSALSPCADDDMTPNNIVNMAILKGLDVIALTDHNSCKNVNAIMEVAKKQGLMVIPGMEVQTKEEVHILCLFKDLNIAMKFDEIVHNCLPNTVNEEQVFGRQLIMNSQDKIMGKEKKLLISSCSLSIDDVFSLVRAFGGFCIPAHIDRTAYSIISNLGFIPPSLGIKTVEISKKSSPESIIKKFSYLKNYNFIISSDAHYLWDISEREYFIDIDYLSFTEIKRFICNK